MSDSKTPLSPARLTVILACGVIIVAGMQAASSMLVPFLSAAFLAVLSLPLVNWMAKRGAPAWLSLTSVLVALLVAALIVLLVIGSSITGFSDKLPDYQANLGGMVADVKTWLQTELEFDVGDSLSNATDPSVLLSFVGVALSQIGGLMGNTFIIMLWLAFILGEASYFGAKVRAVSRDPEEATDRVQKIVQSINRYFSIKIQMGLGTGVAAGILVWIVGVDFPVLWGFVAFLLNFIPNIGSVIAAIPPVLLALVQQDLGVGSAGYVVLGYVIINMVFGSVLEPRLMGRGLNLSTLVVFMSLVFWGFVLGPVGMLLSVPLTVTAKIALEGFPETRGIALLLGSEVPEVESESG